MKDMNQNSKGIVIAVPKKYEKICLNNIQNLRKLGCTLPVEIWEIGEEITDATRKEFLKIEQLTFKNVNDFCDNSKHWKGFQVKAFVFYHASFEEVMLCDADVIIQQNPEVLFQDSNYLKTGAYFFKDLEKWQFSKLTNRWVQLLQKLKYKKFTNAAFFNKRKAWLRTFLPEKSIYFPKEWEYIYWDQLPTEPVKEALQESGVVLMNRKVHQQSFQYIYDL